MPTPSPSGIDKKPSMSGDYSKIKSPMKPYMTKPMGKGKGR